MSCAVWAFVVPGAVAQKITTASAPPSSRPSTSRLLVKPSSVEMHPSSSSDVVTGYDGHYSCRSFTGINRRLAVAVSEAEPTIVAELLRSGADINARASGSHTRGLTILQMAVWHEWGPESVRLAIKAGANIAARDPHGNTALALACQSDLGSNLSVVSLLVRAGANIDAKGAKGMTPLMYAAIHDDSGHLVKRLLQASADVTARDDMGWTALMHTTRRRHDHVDIVRMLAAAGADAKAKHKYGGTALSNAAYNGHTQTVRLLVTAGADINSTDDAKWTPLICSSMNGHFQIVKLLVQSGAKVNAMDRRGRTALNVARVNQHRSIEKLLIQAGANNP